MAENVPSTQGVQDVDALDAERTPRTPDLEFTNTNKWDTRQLVTMALMCAIGVLLSFIEFPLLPGAPWLKYDASAMPAMVCGFAFGPGAGLAVGFVGAILHGILMADFSGAIMNILVVSGFILPAALIYRKRRTFKAAVAGLTLSVVLATLMAILGNLVITPAWLGVPFDAVVAMVLPILTPFNLIKAILNSVLTLVVYKSVSNLITPKKKQVKGR
ncbi:MULTISPECIES: ECF transporter S component [Gordonibacter]|uniref:ECF transporter S component n=1 Tax=Gordonibacter faecis TaxID=3047475 RepID=A0ABT7DMS3_9ACTN|nr:MULTISPECIES: ECF transporter S component [unclassified Gordonibacter]MDJ1650692.1 ECF transporter S component [Gordonibacter sp. KGMB12511]HIW75858.1 ECF transporter S component [Candidatus Gordonibacter avicola]